MQTGGLSSMCSTQMPMAVRLPSMLPQALSSSSSAASGRSLRFVQSDKHLVVSWKAVEARDIRVFSGIKPPSSSGPTAITEQELKKLDNIRLYDTSDAAVSLINLWENRTAVVAFARHFGCLLCRKRADVLQSQKPKMDAAGVALVLIAPGTAEQARKFVEQTNFTGEVYADPDHASYEALEFANGISSVLNPKTGSRVLQAAMEGYRQDWKLSFEKHTWTRGGWLQGGILVAGPGKHTMKYLFKDSEAGDEPIIEDVLLLAAPVDDGL